MSAHTLYLFPSGDIATHTTYNVIIIVPRRHHFTLLRGITEWFYLLWVECDYALSRKRRNERIDFDLLQNIELRSKYKYYVKPIFLSLSNNKRHYAIFIFTVTAIDKNRKMRVRIRTH